ncbi:heme biosynthesis HemY N-terminal domain-containing protein [Marinobacterium arenosum]|uniref:heme biosynthesis HemY N-terminal domain-containing protein n=1 Tax=Marinobacterium arenosum TaxID=2862496 RepID=UPI001C94BB60|nr:heme biosynthesis HemY N-terminal domain-containing protein [Marinobacterium arenosum]MBY4676911.1 heme biosynthesis protein HemY [Marinobacterium arenosum]
MKKLFALLILVLFVGAWLGQKMVQDSGYVLIAYDQTTVETSLWMLLLIVLAGFLLLHWLLNLAFNTRLPTGKLRGWREQRRQRIARHKTLQGLLALSAGDWQKAQRQLGSAAERSDLALVNYLAAARAAHEQGDDQAADELLQKARQSTPNADLAVGITQAQIQLARGQLEPCLAMLLQLRRLAPRNTYVMKLLKDVYIQLKDWQSLSSLLPDLRKQQVLRNDAMLELTRTCHLNRLESSLGNVAVETPDEQRLALLNQAWQSMPTDMTRDLQLVERYCEMLIELGADDQAEQTLKNLIKREWDEGLVTLYGRINSSNAHKQLDQARSWLKGHPQSPALLLTLGRLSLRNQHWGKALDFFRQSLELEPNRETLAELIRLLRSMGNSEDAEATLQQHLQLLSDKLPALPMPGGQS